MDSFPPWGGSREEQKRAQAPAGSASPALGSLCEQGQPPRSQHFRSYCLPLPKGTCLLPPGEKTVASATIAVLGGQIYAGSTIPHGKQR